jgi:hypothetical protein
MNSSQLRGLEVQVSVRYLCPLAPNVLSDLQRSPQVRC